MVFESFNLLSNWILRKFYPVRMSETYLSFTYRISSFNLFILPIWTNWRVAKGWNRSRICLHHEKENRRWISSVIRLVHSLLSRVLVLISSVIGLVHALLCRVLVIISSVIRLVLSLLCRVLVIISSVIRLVHSLLL